MLGLTRGGGEIWDLRMAEQLRNLGVEITFYVGKPLNGDLTAAPVDFPHIPVSTPHLQERALGAPPGIGGVLDDIDSRVFCHRAAAALADSDHDIIHVNSRPDFAQYASRFNRPVTIKLNGPPHSLYHDVLNPFSSSYSLLESFDAIIATGITTEKIKQRISKSVTTINPGVDTTHFVPNKEEKKGNKVLFVGRFVPAKNVTALLEIFSDLQEGHPGAELILVGDGPRRDAIESKMETLGLTASVRMPGYVDNESLPAYYRRADVFALSSQRDNHPITLLEAMSCGVPVVAPTVGWIPNIVNHGHDGFLYDDSDQAVEHLDRLLSNPSLRNEFAKSGRQKAVDGFDWSQRAEALESLFRSLL